MSRILITGGLVADLSNGAATARDLLIDDGRIAAIGVAGRA